MWVNYGDRVKPLGITYVIPAKVLGNNKNLGRTMETHPSLLNVNNHLTELWNPRDTRFNSPPGESAIKVWISGLVVRYFLQFSNIKSLPTDSNLLGGLFVIDIKNIGTEKNIIKSVGVKT